ncbi:MAG: SCO family protein [Leptospira sp.]|nr:SCO family protein [Leptospira sp.]
MKLLTIILFSMTGLFQGCEKFSNTEFFGAESPLKIGGQFQLTDQNGNLRSLSEFNGSYSLLFFGFTSCPDICSMSLAKLDAVSRKFPGEKKPNLLFITVDPKRDSPERLNNYLKNYSEKIWGFTGKKEDLSKIYNLYRVSARENGNQGFDHSGTIYLIDPQGNTKFLYSISANPDNIISDLRRLPKS